MICPVQAVEMACDWCSKVFDLNDYQRIALSAEEARSNAKHYGWKYQNGRDFCPLCVSQGFMPPHGEKDQTPSAASVIRPGHPMACSNGCGRIATHKHNAWYSYCSTCACETCVPFTDLPEETTND